MKIVVKIPDDMIKSLEQGNFGAKYNIYDLAGCLMNGTILPKGHGRLIDADELYGDFIDGTEGYDCNTWNRIEIGDIIEDAPTIIEGSENE